MQPAIPPEAVDAGARALADWLNLDFDQIGDGRATLRTQAEAVLTAAAQPLVADAFERMAHEVDSTGTSDDGEFHKGFKSGQRWFKDILRGHAELLRGK